MGNKIGLQVNKTHIKLVIATDESKQIKFIKENTSQFLVNHFSYGKNEVFQFQSQIQSFLDCPHSHLMNSLNLEQEKNHFNDKLVIQTNWETINIAERNLNLRSALQKIFRVKIQLQHKERVERLVQVSKVFNETQAYFTFSENFRLTQINRFEKLSVSKKKYVNQLPQNYLCVSLKNGCSYYIVRQGNVQKIDGSIMGEKTLINILKLKIPNKKVEQILKNMTKGKLKNTELLVDDIYGKGVEKLGLPKDLVAASLGKMGKMSASQLSNLTDQDITRSLLTTFAINIGIQISLNMRKQDIESAVFIADELHKCYNFYRMVQAVLEAFAPGKKIYFNHYSPFISCIYTALQNDL